jgi:hypothetical protein
MMIPQLDPRSDSFFKGGGKSDDRWALSVCESLCVCTYISRHVHMKSVINTSVRAYVHPL